MTASDDRRVEAVVFAFLMRAQARAPTLLTVRQLAVLLYLWRAGEREFGRVRDALGMSPPALTRAADALTQAGLLARTPSADRRVPILDLTPAGERFAADLVDAAATADCRLPIAGAPEARP